MKFKHYYICALAIASAVTAHAEFTYQPIPSVVNPESDLELPTDESKIFRVTDFGAVADGNTDCTTAIQAAIDAAAGKQGVVLLEGGTFMSAMLNLKSDMTLHIAEGATLKSITEDWHKYSEAGYEPIYPTIHIPTENITFSTNHDNAVNIWPRAFIYAGEADNVTITGNGTIDGNGNYGPWTWFGGDPDELDRPIPILGVKSNNMTISHIHIKDGAMWTVVPVECDNLTIHHISIDSNIVENRDGIDIVDCHNVLIEDCEFNTDDDAICPKSGHVRGVENVTVRRCTIHKSGRANGIKFGTLSYGGFKHMWFEDITIGSTPCAGIAIESVDGADIEDITFKNIQMDGPACPIFVILGDRHRKKPLDSDQFRMGTLKSIRFENITAKNIANNTGCPITGTRVDGVTHRISDIIFDNVDIQFTGGATSIPGNPGEYPKGMYPEYNIFGQLPAYGFFVRHADNVTFRNCDITVIPDDQRPWLATNDVTELEEQNNTHMALEVKNLINEETYVADSGFKPGDMPWLWDGETPGEGVTFPRANEETWIEFDFKQPYDLESFKMWQDNGGAHVSDWKVCTFDDDTNQWTDIFPYKKCDSYGWQQESVDIKAQRIRLYCKCTGNRVSIHEFQCFTKPTEVGGIDAISTSDCPPQAEIIEIYGIDGQRRAALSHGINIVRRADGSVSKIMK